MRVFNCLLVIGLKGYFGKRDIETFELCINLELVYFTNASGVVEQGQLKEMGKEFATGGGRKKGEAKKKGGGVWRRVCSFILLFVFYYNFILLLLLFLITMLFISVSIIRNHFCNCFFFLLQPGSSEFFLPCVGFSISSSLL